MKIKNVKIKAAQNWQLAGYTFKGSRTKFFNDKNYLVTLNGKPISNQFIFKRELGKNVSTNWHLYKKALNKIRNKGYKQKVVIL
tara:strand:+ start:548 stop:799 length:252 start_codon:yes stop_codon:yes gene_type:complete